MADGKKINHKALINEMAGHLDHFNADTFQGLVQVFSVGKFPQLSLWEKSEKFSEPKITAKDLERLITQATNDLKEYDVERHEKFKEYEMQKALEEELKMAKMNELEKKAYQQEEEKRKTAHKKQAQNLPHPVSFCFYF